MDIFSEALRKLLASPSLGWTTTWTPQGAGSKKDLEEALTYASSEIAKELPEFGVIYFVRLPDGGYQIKRSI